MKNNKSFLLAIIVAVSSITVYSYNDAVDAQLQHQEKMADIQYKKEQLKAKQEEKKVKIESKYQEKKSDVQYEQEKAKAKLEREKKEAEAQYNKQQLLSGSKEFENRDDLWRYKSMNREIKSYK